MGTRIHTHWFGFCPVGSWLIGLAPMSVSWAHLLRAVADDQHADPQLRPKGTQCDDECIVPKTLMRRDPFVLGPIQAPRHGGGMTRERTSIWPSGLRPCNAILALSLSRRSTSAATRCSISSSITAEAPAPHVNHNPKGSRC